MAKTAIKWATHVWNPVTGCSRVSRGCDNCYAFALHDFRHLQNKAALAKHNDWRRGWFGSQIPDLTFELARGDAIASAELPWPAQYDQPFSTVQLLPDRLEQPVSWGPRTKPRRVFANSMSDLFHERIPEAYIDQVFAAMALADRHQFLVLTKRPERMLEYLTEHMDRPANQTPQARIARAAEELAAGRGEDVSSPWWDLWLERWPLANVWLGVSVEDQATADKRIPLLLKVPAAVHWASFEPLLDEVRIGRWLPEHPPALQLEPALDWAVVGGESGPRAREMDLRWAHMIQSSCEQAGVAYFGKQASGPKAGAPLPGELGAQAFPMQPLEHLRSAAYTDRHDHPEPPR